MTTPSDPRDFLNDLTRSAAGLGPHRVNVSPPGMPPSPPVEAEAAPVLPPSEEPAPPEIKPVPLGGFPSDDTEWIDSITAGSEQ